MIVRNIKTPEGDGKIRILTTFKNEFCLLETSKPRKGTENKVYMHISTIPLLETSKPRKGTEKYSIVCFTFYVRRVRNIKTPEGDGNAYVKNVLIKCTG